MWKFKGGGWSNFTIYIAQDSTELFVSAEDSEEEIARQYIPQGKIYFTENKDEVGYITKGYRIEGVMRLKKVGKLKLKKSDFK